MDDFSTNHTASQIQAMSQTLHLFAFGDNRIRVTADEAGEPWFVASDVCRALDIHNTSDAVSNCHLDEDEKGIVLNDTPGGTQKMVCVRESGVYALIERSRKPEAQPFRAWVRREVLPTIRKTGSYSVAAPAVMPSLPEALRGWADALDAKQALQLENAELKPKAEFFDAVTASDDTLGMNEAAKLLGHGRNKLMAFLRKTHVFRLNNTPYQEFIDAGYFKVVESTWADKESANHVTLSTRVFQRGVEFIRRKLGKQ